MNACVNDDACIGCVGKAYALDTAEENRSAVQEAIDACPTAAISWTD